MQKLDALYAKSIWYNRKPQSEVGFSTPQSSRLMPTHSGECLGRWYVHTCPHCTRCCSAMLLGTGGSRQVHDHHTPQNSKSFHIPCPRNAYVSRQKPMLRGFFATLKSFWSENHESNRNVFAYHWSKPQFVTWDSGHIPNIHYRFCYRNIYMMYNIIDIMYHGRPLLGIEPKQTEGAVSEWFWGPAPLSLQTVIYWSFGDII